MNYLTVSCPEIKPTISLIGFFIYSNFIKGLIPVRDIDRYQHKLDKCLQYVQHKIFNHIQIYIQVIHYYSLFINNLFAKKDNSDQNML